MKNENRLKTDDLIKYLDELTRTINFLEPEGTNAGKFLSRLSKALLPHAKKPFSEVEDLLAKNKTLIKKEPTCKIELPAELALLQKSEVMEILENDSYSNKQLIKLGNSRLGISASRLQRLKRSRIIEIIEAALDHESSLEIISKEAKNSGEKRSS